MKTTKTVSVIPDASLLIESWERAAAGREEEAHEPVRGELPRPRIGLLLCLLSALTILLIGRWLCGC